MFTAARSGAGRRSSTGSIRTAGGHPGSYTAHRCAVPRSGLEMGSCPSRIDPLGVRDSSLRAADEGHDLTELLGRTDRDVLELSALHVYGGLEHPRERGSDPLQEV